MPLAREAGHRGFRYSQVSTTLAIDSHTHVPVPGSPGPLLRTLPVRAVGAGEAGRRLVGRDDPRTQLRGGAAPRDHRRRILAADPRRDLHLCRPAKGLRLLAGPWTGARRRTRPPIRSAWCSTHARSSASTTRPPRKTRRKYLRRGWRGEERVRRQSARLLHPGGCESPGLPGSRNGRSGPLVFAL